MDMDFNFIILLKTIRHFVLVSCLYRGISEENTLPASRNLDSKCEKWNDEGYKQREQKRRAGNSAGRAFGNDLNYACSKQACTSIFSTQRFGKVKEGLGLQCESPAGEEAKVGDGCGCQGERKAKDDGLHGWIFQWSTQEWMEIWTSGWGWSSFPS